jgi:hypothetical protein
VQIKPFPRALRVNPDLEFERNAAKISSNTGETPCSVTTAKRTFVGNCDVEVQQSQQMSSSMSLSGDYCITNEWRSYHAVKMVLVLAKRTNGYKKVM